MKICILVTIFCTLSIVSSVSIDGMKTTYEVLKEGTGDRQVVNGDGINLHATGSLAADGTKFWSSKDSGQTFAATVGAGQLIKGFDAALVGLKAGEVRDLTIPFAEGYGASGAGGVIPPSADLKFEIELVSWQGEQEL